MPRKARIDAPGALHHIMARGIEGRPIFQNDHDRYDFIKRLAFILEETETKCLAWALIPNHFHLLLISGVAPVAKVMLRLLTGYAVSHNLRHNRQGLSTSTISQCVKRGEEIARNMGYSLLDH